MTIHRFKSVEDMVRSMHKFKVGDICSAYFFGGQRIRGNKKHRSKWKKPVYTKYVNGDLQQKYVIEKAPDHLVDGGKLIDLTPMSAHGLFK